MTDTFLCRSTCPTSTTTSPCLSAIWHRRQKRRACASCFRMRRQSLWLQTTRGSRAVLDTSSSKRRKRLRRRWRGIASSSTAGRCTFPNAAEEEEVPHRSRSSTRPAQRGTSCSCVVCPRVSRRRISRRCFRSSALSPSGSSLNVAANPKVRISLM